VNLVLE